MKNSRYTFVGIFFLGTSCEFITTKSSRRHHFHFEYRQLPQYFTHQYSFQLEEC